jgi:hypothetical protein
MIHLKEVYGGPSVKCSISKGEGREGTLLRNA